MHGHSQCKSSWKSPLYYKTLYNLQNNKISNATDDASLFISAGKKIKLINGEINNKKIKIN